MDISAWIPGLSLLVSAGAAIGAAKAHHTASTALRYARPGRGQGDVRWELTRISPDMVRLSNVGLADAVDVRMPADRLKGFDLAGLPDGLTIKAGGVYDFQISPNLSSPKVTTVPLLWAGVREPTELPLP